MKKANPGRGISVAVHLLFSRSEGLGEIRGSLPDFGYRKPGTIFCYPGLYYGVAHDLKNLLDGNGHCTDIKVFNGFKEFPFPTAYDYLVVAADLDCLLQIGFNVIGDSPLREEFKKGMSSSNNMVSIHFPLTDRLKKPWITTGNIAMAEVLDGVDV